MEITADAKLGANYLGDGRCEFLVWAPRAEKVEVHLVSPGKRSLPLKRIDRGYHFGRLDGIDPGATYFYRLDGKKERPDPASRCQPNSVHDASQIVAHEFSWHDRPWLGLPLEDYIIYELHVGTFTPEGTFEAIIPQLDRLRSLGINALELMPVAQFPGGRNWGYDGVYPFAPQNSYGGPAGLKRLVNACHLAGLAVVLDVVYNHLGPEGNYLEDFGPYFSDAYRIAWGKPFNFDGAFSDEVRRFFIENALQWQVEFHIDALRLDAIHAIRDLSALPFLQELRRVTRRRADQLKRPFHLIAESDLNDPRCILPETSGGYGLDAQWSDDFHHCLHVLLTGEQQGYYADFGGLEQFARLLHEGYAYTGQYSRFRNRRFGASTRCNPAKQFVVSSQNHDQVGNRRLGERLTQLVPFEALKLAAGCVLLSPFIPLLFMGEEYGEPAPFLYFISHGDPALVETVRKGRREEFSGWDKQGEAPDPQSEETFRHSKLNSRPSALNQQQRALFEFYRALTQLRKTTPAIARAEKQTLQVQTFEAAPALAVLYPAANQSVCVLLCFANRPTRAELELPVGVWEKVLDSDEKAWGGHAGSRPEQLNSTGRVMVELNPKSVLVWQQSQET